MAAPDLQALLVAGNESTYPMTLRYQGRSIGGTIRQRTGGNSRCGEKRQFKLKFPDDVTLPDGYRTDGFETDRGACLVMHEWFSGWMARSAAGLHPEIPMLWKHANLVVLYFNDQLYHVQTLTEDANKDLVERFERTRNVALYKHGCYGAPPSGWIGEFCRTFDPRRITRLLDVRTYLYWVALVKSLSPSDNYPDYPWNWYLVRNLDTGIARPLGDDWDLLPAQWLDATLDPFTLRYEEGDTQRHFVELLGVREHRDRYRRYLRDMRRLLDPDEVLPVIAAKYRQIRALLHASPDLPFPYGEGRVFYDYTYQEELPEWVRARYQCLRRLIP
jgi:hypothetical protein